MFIEKDSVNYYRLMHAERGILKDTWDAIQQGRGGIVTLAEAIQHVENDANNVFFGSESDVIAFYDDNCKLRQGHMGKTAYFPISAGFPIRCGYKHTPTINKLISQLIEGGLFDHMTDRYSNKKCDLPLEENTQVASLSHVKDAFLILLWGICLSFLSLSMNHLIPILYHFIL